MIVADCPWSITIDVGEIATISPVPTVTVVGVTGVAERVGFAPPVVPVSVTVTVITQVVVVLVGV